MINKRLEEIRDRLVEIVDPLPTTTTRDMIVRLAGCVGALVDYLARKEEDEWETRMTQSGDM